MHRELMPEDMLGARVRTLREKLGLTHDGLSSLTKVVDQEGRGISRTTIRGYELGAYKPRAREFRILSMALRVSPTWLLMGENESTSITTSGSGQDKPGDAIRGHTLSGFFAEARDLSGLCCPEGKTPPSFHELRSFSARLYTEQGINAQALLGHKSADMTAIYRDTRGAEWIEVKTT